MDINTGNIAKGFSETKNKLFVENLNQQNPLLFSMEYSLLVEEYIRVIAGNKKYNFALVSAGSFSRRELSPFSDIDVIIIVDSLEGNENDISALITSFWDNGLEISHTIRDNNDIRKYLTSDLKTFTQFFETRFLLGSEKIYAEWNKSLFETIDEKEKSNLVMKLSEDVESRYEKYGNSPKILEPNVKYSAGGLRDFQTVEWMFIINNKVLIDKQNELSQAEVFIQMLEEYNYTSKEECIRLLESYRLILSVRNLLHLINNQKYDRFEFQFQAKVSEILSHKNNYLLGFMRNYFEAANILNRFLKSMMKKFQEDIANPLPASLAFNLDEDFIIKGKQISLTTPRKLSLSEIFRAFYYRGFHGGHFDEELRSIVISSIEERSLNIPENESSVFFREILMLPKNVGQTLTMMNELGVLGAFLPEFDDLIGFFQVGVYHCYTIDEHTLYAISNAENLEKDGTLIGKVFRGIKNKEILYLSLLFHDIAKPINISGHEIIGAEMASSIMSRLGYSDEEIEKVSFLVRNHLVMEQTAFRRNINDPETLNNFASRFTSTNMLEHLFVLTYADLSAVNSAVWTSWKNELISELYLKSKVMIEEQLTGEEVLVSSLNVLTQDSKFSSSLNKKLKEHIESMNDIAYLYEFTEEEIAQHIKEIQKGDPLSLLFKELNDFTNITIITKDTYALLSKICGVMAINDVNIHDARIFTRKDKVIIDTFNVTDFRTHKKIEEGRYSKIRHNLKDVIDGILQLNVEFENMRSRWKRIESKFFKRSGKIKVVFDKHEKYTIIEIHSPDRLGFLYQVTKKMNEIGLAIYFAKISTKGDDIVDTFYVLNSMGKKISQNDYEFIRSEIIESISQIL